MTGIPVPDELNAAFQDLIDDTKAIEAKYAHFCAAIHAEQKSLAVIASDLWRETKSVLKLEGNWRYDGGMVHPVREPNAPDNFFQHIYAVRSKR